jgi:hypothetical protein
MEGMWLIHADVSSYWKSFRKREDIGIYVYHTLWATRYGTGYGPVGTQTTQWMNNGLHHSSVVCVTHANSVPKTKSQDSGRFKLNGITLNYKAPRWHGQVAKFQLICAAVYFGRSSNNSLTLWHTPSVTSADHQATVLYKFIVDVRDARRCLMANDQAVTTQTSRNTQSFTEFKVLLMCPNCLPSISDKYTLFLTCLTYI